MICRHGRTEFYGVTGEAGVCTDEHLFGYQEALYPFFGRHVRVQFMGGWIPDFEYVTRVEIEGSELSLAEEAQGGTLSGDIAPFLVAGKHFHAILTPYDDREITVAFDDPHCLGDYPWDELTEAWAEAVRNAEAVMGDSVGLLSWTWRAWDGGTARSGRFLLARDRGNEVVAIRPDRPKEENRDARSFFHRLMDDEGWSHEPLAVCLGVA